MNALLLTGGRVIDPTNRFDAVADVPVLGAAMAMFSYIPSTQFEVDATAAIIHRRGVNFPIILAARL